MKPLLLRLRPVAVRWVLTVLVAGWSPLVGAQSGHGGHGGTGTEEVPDTAVITPLQVTLTPFLDRLPIPSVLQPSRTTNGFTVPVATNLHYPQALDVYDVPMREVSHQFHAQLPPVPVWGYAGSYPGPTIEARVGVPLLVNWINQLTNHAGRYPHWMAVNTNLFHDAHGAGMPADTIRTVVHLHGAPVLPRYDGYPTNWFAPGESDLYFYGNVDLNADGQTLWYHDHALGATANNVYAGLAGFYLVRNPELEQERGIQLPSGPYEVPLVFQDRDFGVTTFTNSHGVIQTETNLFLGGFPWRTHAVVNGKVTPYLEVEPRVYRLRLLNGANFRTFAPRLAVTDAAGNLYPADSAAPPSPTFTVIGNEDGFLPTAASNVQRIAMMPGERVDVLVDFSAYTNAPYTNITVQNAFGLPNILFQGPTNQFNPGGGGGAEANTIVISNQNVVTFITNLMQFRVTAPAPAPTPAPAVVLPPVLVPDWETTEAMAATAVVTRQVRLELLPTGLHFALINRSPFSDPITEFPHAGDTEIWEIVNLSQDAHPLHIHLLDFRVYNRQAFAAGGVASYTLDWNEQRLQPLTNYLAKALRAPADFESGPKDVVRAAPNAVTRIVMRWPTNEIFYATPSGRSGEPSSHGRFIYHCHILDHEDDDMMRPLQLLPPWRPVLSVRPGPAPLPGAFNPLQIVHQGRPGERYTLESSTNLASGTWTAVIDPNDTPPAVDPGTGLVRHAPPETTASLQFYRVTVTAPGGD